jgi:hypothetical protein
LSKAPGARKCPTPTVRYIGTFFERLGDSSQFEAAEGRRAVAAPSGADTNCRDDRINSYAVAVLHDEALAARSANIDTVSGATVTSNGYIRSLQPAIDAAPVARS